MTHDLSTIEMTYEAHAAQARARARAWGAHDCIHYAPGWHRRSNALYEAASEVYETTGLRWWEGEPGGQPWLIEDGRMVVACETVWFVELKEPS